MMNRFCRYVEKVFDFGFRMGRLQDSRLRPRIPLKGDLGQCLFPLCFAAAQLTCYGTTVAPAPQNGLADREKKWGAFLADQERLAKFAETEKNGPLVGQLTAHMLRPTPYSPMQ